MSNQLPKTICFICGLSVMSDDAKNSSRSRNPNTRPETMTVGIGVMNELRIDSLLEQFSLVYGDLMFRMRHTCRHCAHSKGTDTRNIFRQRDNT